MSKLVFRYGSMNASKSAQLIMDWYNANQNGKSTLVFKPVQDTRSHKVTSRAIKTEIYAKNVHPSDYNYMYNLALSIMPRIIFVDEVNFFTPAQIEELARIVDDIGVTVIAYGLMTSFKGEMFAGSKRLVELADVVERVRSECTKCDKEGIMNARFENGVIQTGGALISIGAEESYQVLCRKCYNVEMNKVERGNK